MGTMDTLVDDLLLQPASRARDELVRRALTGQYHDFKSDHPTPKIALVGDLVHYGYRELARKARSGAYDDKPDEEDEAEFRRLVGESPDLAEIDRKFRAGEISYEQAVVAAMQTLDPADRIRAAVEMDITRSATPKKE